MLERDIAAGVYGPPSAIRDLLRGAEEPDNIQKAKLLGDDEVAQEAQEELRQRGFSEQVVEEARLGVLEVE